MSEPRTFSTIVPGVLTPVLTIWPALDQYGSQRSFHAWDNCAESRSLAGMFTGIARLLDLEAFEPSA